MGRFVIDADTRGAWKSVGDTGCRASSVASEYLSPHGVEFAGGCAGSDGFHHGLAGFGDNATSTKKRIEILLLVNRHSRDSTPHGDDPSRRTGTFSGAPRSASTFHESPAARANPASGSSSRLLRQRSERRGMATLRSILVGRGEP